MTVQDLDAVFAGAPGRSKGCPVCGERPAAAIMIQIRELDDTGRYVVGGKLRTKSRRACATHAAEVYTILEGTLLRETQP